MWNALTLILALLFCRAFAASGAEPVHVPVVDETLKTEELVDRATDAIENIDRLTRQLQKALDGKLDSLLLNLDKTAANLRAITTKINQGGGTLGRLVNDQELASEVTNIITTTKQTQVLVSTKAFVATRDAEYRTDVFARLVLASNGVFILGANYRSLPISGDSDLTAHIQIGKRFGDFGVHAGLFESTGGVGLELLVPEIRSRLFAEAYRFSGSSPQVNSGLEVDVYGPLLFWMGGDALTIPARRSFFVGGGLQLWLM